MRTQSDQYDRDQDRFDRMERRQATHLALLLAVAVIAVVSWLLSR